MKKNNRPRFKFKYINELEPGSYFFLVEYCFECVLGYMGKNTGLYYAMPVIKCKRHYNNSYKPFTITNEPLIPVPLEIKY